MPITPTEWNVNILGFWNRAILTPSGISKRLFLLDAGTPVEILVAIDILAPHQVKHDGITVIAASDRLVIQPDQCDFQSLEKAKGIAQRALEKLPETPVVAAGINFKYTCKEPLDVLQQVTRQEFLDMHLSDKSYPILGRSISRSLKWGDGQINFSITEDADGKAQLTFNFHRASNEVSDLKSWISTPISDIETQVNQLLFDCIQIKAENIENGRAISKD